MALADRVATNRVAAAREPAAREPVARAAAPMAVILVQADLRLPAGVRRPAVRAASATLPVHLGHCFSSDLSRRWLAFAGKGVVVVRWIERYTSRAPRPCGLNLTALDARTVGGGAVPSNLPTVPSLGPDSRSSWSGHRCRGGPFAGCQSRRNQTPRLSTSSPLGRR